MIAVGRHDDRLAMVPYEEKEDTITPVTIHVTTRHQINFRPTTGREFALINTGRKVIRLMP